LVKEKNIAYVNFLMVRNGTIIQTHNTCVETHLDETLVEILSFSIGQLRQTFNSDANEIIIPFSIEYPENVTVTIPKGGEKKKLLDLSETNANYFIEELKRKERLKTGIKDHEKIKVLQQLQSDLQLPELPVQIECFDNSNFQGSYPVAAMVTFKNGLPDKKNYRHFNIKTVKGIDDFASMKEVVYRRYKRVIEEKESFPQLIIIDGGKGQLNAALEALDELNAKRQTTTIGLAKNEEEIFFPGDKQPLKLPYNSESLKLIRAVRNEVHRFGITFHRHKRSKGTFKNELEEIPGIGKNTVDILLKEFKSVKKIAEADKNELVKVIGKSKAEAIKNYFKGKNNDLQAKKMGPG
jgi:excinuclease ABC subunit C